MKYYRDGDNYVQVTGECPKGFKDALFIAHEGRRIGSKLTLMETALSKAQIDSFEEIDEDDLPDDYKVEFGIETTPEPEPEPVVYDYPVTYPQTDVEAIFELCAQPYAWVVVIIFMLLGIGFVGLL